MNLSTPVASAAALPNPAESVDAKEIARSRDTRAPVRLGLWVLVVGFGLFLLWASWAPLEEGVPAQATVGVESRRTSIQHVSGGVIKAVHVRNGDEVAVGDVLVELDDSQERAIYEAVRQNYLAQRALEGRLLAELSNAASISFHPDLLKSRDPQAAQHMKVQTQLFSARRAAHAAQVQGAEQLISGMQSQIQGTAQMLLSRREQLALMKRQLESVSRLADEDFAPRNQVLQLEQAHADLSATIANLETESQRQQHAVAEGRYRVAALQQEFVKDMSSQMAEVQREVLANQERLVAVETDLSRTRITSPAAGQVIGLAVPNLGGVVERGRTLMDILPRGVPLVLDVKIPPHVISSVAVGQEVEVRFSAFASTPHLVVLGRLLSVAGDVVTEQQGGMVHSFYAAQVELTPEGMKALGHQTVQPGMSAEVLIRTGERSMLDYLLDPLLRRVSASMTER